MENSVDLNNVKVAFSHKNDGELRKTIFIYRLIQRPFLVVILSKVAGWILKYKIPLKFLLKNTVFKLFCAGQNRKEAQITMNKLKEHNVNTVLDYVAEGDNSEASFKINLETILENIRFVSLENKEPFVGVKLSGLEDVDFIKTVGYSDSSSDAEEKRRKEQFIERVNEICALAVSKNVKVYFDAEEKSTQDFYDLIVEEMMRKYNKTKILIYTTLQMYMKDRVAYLEYLVEDAKEKEYLIGVKLVRGAYMEKERKYAEIAGVKSPVFETKIQTDYSFDQAVTICLKEYAIVATCLATHNQQSVELALKLIEQNNIINHYERVFFSQLYGMSDNLTFNLAKGHYNSSKYVPYGEVEKAIPYLLRRAEENSSIEGQTSRELELLNQEKSRRKK